MTSCQCGACILGRLQGISSLLGRGRAGMAATALLSVITELTAHVTAAKAPPAPRHQPPKLGGPATSIGRAQRLARILQEQPALRVTAAKALGVRLADLDAIQTGRVLLTSQRWNRLFDALASKS